jgi:uncharacterized protein YdbL (DUF1318 family)
MHMKKSMLTIVAMVSVLWALPALALDLHSARSSGQVGEKLDGYVEALQSSPEVQTLVSEVNAKRRAEYARISQQNGQPVDVVAKLAAAQVIGGLPSGAMYQDNGGNWKKR